MTGLAAFVDADAVVREWVNINTNLVGPGNPLPLGAHLRRLRSPMKGAYALITRIGGYDDSGEAPIDYARVSASIYGGTAESAGLAATAYANALRAMDGSPQVMPSGAGTVMAVTQIVGPLRSDDNDEPRYLVDALVLCRP